MHNTPLTNAIVTEEQEITKTNPALAWIAHIAPGDPNQRCFIGPRPVRNHFLKGILSSTATTAFHVTITPDRAKMSINEVQQLYTLPDFGRLLSDYIAKASNGQPAMSWSCDRGHVKTWNKFQLQLHSVFRSHLIMPSQVIQAGLPSQIFPLGNCDAVIMQSSHADQTGKIYFMQLHITNCSLCSKSYCTSASYLPAHSTSSRHTSPLPCRSTTDLCTIL
jgi:hypothetical protein